LVWGGCRFRTSLHSTLFELAVCVSVPGGSVVCAPLRAGSVRQPEPHEKQGHNAVRGKGAISDKGVVSRAESVMSERVRYLEPARPARARARAHGRRARPPRPSPATVPPRAPSGRPSRHTHDTGHSAVIPHTAGKRLLVPFIQLYGFTRTAHWRGRRQRSAAVRALTARRGSARAPSRRLRSLRRRARGRA
jgi:hypothetical protein